MKTLAWNCRGLGNQTTVRALKKILECENPDVVFLMETRLVTQQIQYLNLRQLKFHGCLSVDCIGEDRRRKGGICLLWKEDVDFNLLSFSSNHILGKIKAGGDHDNWFFSGVYGWPENPNKWRTWDLLKRIRMDTTEPWLCCGDFNEILWSYEKSGGANRSLQAMDLFWETLNVCNLGDLGYTGHKFTWSNGRKGDENIQERLDRALANDKWREIFPNYRVRHLQRLCSDHAPLLVIFDSDSLNDDEQKRKKKRFRFENMWFQDPSFRSLVTNTWQIRTAGCNFEEKIKICGHILLEWDKDQFGNVRKKIKNLKEKFGELQQRIQSESVVDESRDVENELNKCYKMEETMWFPRSRALWLKDGDKNSKFFHNKAANA